MAGIFGTKIGSGEGKEKARNLLAAADQFARSSAGAATAERPTVSGPEVPTSVTVPELQRPGGNTAPDFGSPGFVPIDPIEIEESGILSEVSAVSSELLSGELPEDVVRQIRPCPNLE